MNKRRNVVIIGAPDSGVTELFEALLRLDETPKPEPIETPNTWGAWDGLLDWTEYAPKPCNAKLRKKILSK